MIAINKEYVERRSKKPKIVNGNDNNHPQLSSDLRAICYLSKYLRETSEAYLERRGLSSHRQFIIPDLFKKISGELPDNVEYHQDITLTLRDTVKTYIDRWEMYNRMFNQQTEH